MNQTRPPWPWAFVRAFVLIIIFFVTVAVNVEVSQCIGNASDGASWIHLFQYSAQLGRNFSPSAADPLQGLFDVSNSGIGQFFLSALMSGSALFGVYSNAFAIAGLVTFFALAVVYFLWAFDLIPSFRLEAGLLSALVLFVPHGLSEVYNCVIGPVMSISPHIPYILGMSLILVASFQRISAAPRSIFHICVAAACLFFLFYEFPLTSTLLAIFVFCVGTACIVFSTSLSEAIAKTVAGGVLVIVLAATGTIWYVLSFGTYLDIYFFPDELQGAGWAGGSLTVAPSLKNLLHDFVLVAFWINPHTDSIIYFHPNSVLMMMAVLASVLMAIAPHQRNERLVACALLTSIIICSSFYFIAHYYGYFTGGKYTGPSPFHFSYAHWSLAVISILLGLSSVLQRLANWRVGALIKRNALSLRTAAGTAAACAPALLAIPAFGSASQSWYDGLLAHDFTSSWAKPYLNWDAKANRITDHLKTEIGLTGDAAQFRGRVVTVAAHREQYETCLRDHGYYNPRDMVVNEFWNDGYLAQVADIRNDMRHVGLWAHNIPTLYQISGTRAADLFLFLAAFMAGPDIKQIRTYFVINRLPESVLRMIGVKYAITDFSRADEPVLQVSVRPGRGPDNNPALQKFVDTCSPFLSQDLYLHRLNNANLGQYAPREWQRAENALEALTLMNRPDFDPEMLGIHFGGREPVVGQRPDDVSISYQNGYLKIAVTADEPTTLLLPIQFSKCWEVLEQEAGSQVRLFRANLLLTGAEIAGTTRFTLSLTHRPFFKHGCRIEDSADFAKLGVGQEALDRFRAASE